MTNRQIRLGLHLFFWGLIAASFIWLFSIVFTFWEAVTVVSVNVLLLVGLFYFQVAAVNWFWERKKTGLFLTISLLMLLLVTALRIAISNHLVGSHVPPGILTGFQRLLVFQIFTSLLVSLIAIFYQLLQNRYQRERHNLAQLQAQQTAQLQLLRAQMNPHFLFNALNNLYSLTVAKSDDAPKMLLRLSNLLRYVIYESQKTVLLLTQEVAHLEAFIALFKMRSEQPLRITLTTEGDLAGYSIEPMLLMPMVENCFKHSDFETNPDAFIALTLTVRDGQLRFCTRNTFDRRNQQKDAVGGVGLTNIRHRLSLRYLEFGLETHENGAVFEVVLTIHTL